jgi:lipoprotein-anchoring transpeptidase ErfK/SrfK
MLTRPIVTEAMQIATQVNSLRVHLLRALILSAGVCVLALVAGCLIGRPTQDVLAEAQATAQPSRMPLSPTASPSPTPTAEPTCIAIAAPASATPSPTVAAASPSHTVQAGETLERIASTYGVSVDELVIVNELANPDLLCVGQRLRLPSAATIPTPSEASSIASPAESTPNPSLASPDEIIAGRWIDVDLSEQRLTAYEGETPVRSTLVSTGLPNTPTPVGQFRIWIKLRYDDMAGAEYYIDDVPYVMYFHEGYGLHGVTWHGNFGHPMSHGCVNLPTREAEWLFNWAEVGTLVNIRD